MLKQIFLIFCLLTGISSFSQNRYELNSGWLCANIKDVKADGAAISSTDYTLKNWLPATVPGTVLTTLLNNKRVPDPFYGMNNKYIPDIFSTGNDYYTYWFVKDFKEAAKPGEQVWLELRGVNYRYDLFLNGKKTE